MRKLKETKFPLLNRIEVIYEIEHARQPTPRKEQVKKQIAAELKINEDLINIYKVATNFGVSRTRITADVYNSKEDMEILIKKNKKTKDKKNGKEESKEQKA